MSFGEQVAKTARGPYSTLVAATAVVGLIAYKLAQRKRRRPKGVPCIPGHWILGNAPQVIQAARQKRHLELGLNHHRTYGKTVALKALGRPWVVKTTCPKNLEHILKTNFDNYPKGPFFQTRLQDLLGDGIFNIDGHSWYTQRKTSSRMFTAKLFKEHIWVVLRRNAQKLRNILESSDPDKSVDVFNLMNRFTLDTIGEIGFGQCIGSLEDPSSPFLASFDKAQQISFWRFRNPLWRLMRFLGVGTERETRDHLGRLDAYSRSIVRELRDAINQKSAHGKGHAVTWSDMEASKSFVGLFLEEATQQGETLSDDYLRDLVLNFLIAGRDTTAQGLSWTIYCLSQHPEVEEAARQEVVDVCGVRGPVYDDIPRLQYLNAIINEALRLYPSVPADGKVALRDDTLPDGTFIPGGTNIAYDIYSMGRDCSIWGLDAESFRPQRWLEMKETPSSYQFPAFNGGPRECLGKRLAVIEMKTCLAMLLPHISFQLAVPTSAITPDLQLTIGMAGGLPCFVRKVLEHEKGGSNVSTTVSTIQSECGGASEFEALLSD